MKFQRAKFETLADDFFMVTVVSNAARYHRRYELFEQFQAMMEQTHVQLVAVEIAFGDRPFEVTSSSNPNHLQLRTIEEFWHKENATNLGISHGRKLWPNKKNVGWCDADCAPVGRSASEWLDETWHELQHYKFVQMWEWLLPLDYQKAPLGGATPSFMSNYIKFGTPYPSATKGYPVQWGSPGLCWAANISALDEINQIGDAGICGAGDWYLAHMLISDLPFADFKNSNYAPGYINYWKIRQNLCEKWIKRDVGFVSGTMTHFFHGAIKNRQYNTREQILISNQFDPATDLKRDSQGLWQLETWEPRQIRLRDQLRQYFRQRNEDSIDSQ
jgi:hypothetical protein